MEKKLIKIRESSKEIIIISGINSTDALKDILNNYNGTYIVTNHKVWNLWGYKIRDILRNRFFLYTLPDGERYKNISSVMKIYNFLTENKATRNSCLIAFGGGVIGDLAGFSASTYHRGMKLIHIPTTLLSMVDSSIGGKTGFNLRSGKNLVGTFYQPDYIISDTNYLSSLDRNEFLSGLAEIIKAGLISDKGLFDLLEKNQKKIMAVDKELIDKIISVAQNIKIKVITKDEKEGGLRAILNFGHTFGHSLERLSNWKIMHGFAVAQGIAFESYLSYLRGFLSLNKLKRIIGLLKKYDYSLKAKYPVNRMKESFIYDKKRKNKEVEWVLLKDIGKASCGEIVDERLLDMALEGYYNLNKNQICL
ncbi:MAG: 3-dehydroquinate synthase [Proteobacteria bacterium]|nr:3-dehydroquinate synthase [Pseudomonadota bacterium]